MKLLSLGSLFLLFGLLLNAKEYDFHLICDKNRIYKGEKFKLEYRFTFKDPKKIAEVNFSPPLFHNLHVENKNYSQTKNSQSWIYTLSAYGDKNVSASAAYLDIAIKKDVNKTLGNFDEYDYDYISLETKPVTFKIIKKEVSTKLFGNFDIKSDIKQKDDFYELTLKISGTGNFKDIGKYKLNLKSATVYADKPTIKKNLFLQKFIIVSDESFIIPPFEITYTDAKSKKVVVKKTKEIFVEKKVTKTEQKEKPKNKNIPEKLNYTHLIALFLGILVGFLLSKIRFKKKVPKNRELYYKVKDTKDKKEILNILLSHSQDPKISKLIKDLENDLYISKENKITKKEILKHL